MRDLKTASEIEKHLQQITNEAAAFLKGLNAELEQAEANVMDPAYMEQVEKRLTDANTAYEKTIKEWKVKLAEALKAEKHGDVLQGSNRHPVQMAGIHFAGLVIIFEFIHPGRNDKHNNLYLVIV